MNRILFLLLLCGVQISLSAFSNESSFAAHRARGKTQGDRFIPERTNDPITLAIRDLQSEDFFRESKTESLEQFLFRESLSRRLLGVSLEEGSRRSILFPGKSFGSSAQVSTDIGEVLRKRDYKAEHGFLKTYDAPGFTNNYFFRTLAVKGGDIAVALREYSEEDDFEVDSLYLMLKTTEPESGVVRVGASIEQVSFMKWLNDKDLFIGKDNGVWSLTRVNSAHDVPILYFFDPNTVPFGPHLVVAPQTCVIGARYLSSDQDLLVGYASGEFVRFDLRPLAQGLPPNRVLVHQLPPDLVSFEMTADKSHLAVGTRNRGVSIHQWPSFHQVAEIRVEDAATKALSWHPNQKWLAIGAGAGDRRVMIYSLDKNKVLFEHDTRRQVCDVAWSARGTELVASLGYRMRQTAELNAAVDGAEGIDGDASAAAGESNSSLIVWAVAKHADGVCLRAISGLPEIKGRALSLFLDDQEMGGRIFTRAHVLAEDGDGVIMSMRWSRAKLSSAGHDVKQGLGLFGFGGPYTIR